MTQHSPPGAADLARRLKVAGAKFYGAFWCSHCFDQKQEFGMEAQEDLPYVECYPQGFSKVRWSIPRSCEATFLDGMIEVGLLIHVHWWSLLE